ncbi:MAG: hypothetical protein EOM72_11695 [Opitutae bacterium]|nr:hypothetical protein [Opitutae bacterium]
MNTETFAAVPSERALIGALLTDPAAVLPLCDAAGLSAKSFTDPDARAAFAAVAALQAEGNPVDLAAVAQEMAGDAASLETLARFMDVSLTVAHAEYHARKVRESESKAKLAAALRDTLQDLQTGGSAADAVAKAQAAGEAVEAHGMGGPRIVSAADFAAVNRPEPPEVIRGVLRAKQTAMLSAASKVGKTWAMLAAGFAVSSGARWFGWQTTPGRVLYINGELPEYDLEQRLRTLAEAMGLPGVPSGLDVWHLRGHPMSLDGLIPSVLYRQRQIGTPYALIIPDPLYKFNQGRDEIDNTAQAATVEDLGRLAERSGAAVLVCHHFSKGNQSAKDHLDRASGAGTLGGRGPDTALTLTAHDEPDCYTLEVTCRSFAKPAKAVARWEYPLWRIDDSLDPEKLKQPSKGRASKYTPEKIVDLLPDGETTHGDWLKAAKAATGISKTRFNEVVSLAKARQLVFYCFGKYTRTGGETP